MKFLPFKVHPRLFAMLALSFVIATIIGTVSHELGHCSVAKILGYDVELHYASMTNSNYFEEHHLEAYYDKHIDKIMSKEPSVEKETFKNLYERGKIENLLIILGGPLQTIIVGSIGLMWLYYHRKKIMAKAELSVKEWFAVIVAFFWSRQLFNLLSGMLSFISSKAFPKGGDESRISLYFGVPVSTVDVITGMVSLALLLWVIFYIIPINQRLSFILAGMAGSALGFVIWMQWIGPVVLP